MPNSDVVAARAQARAALETVEDDPEARVRLRELFYHRAWSRRSMGPGLSELAFTRWECRRGVLAPPGRGGSPWWRAVNDQIVLDAETAESLLEAAADGLSLGERAWWRWLHSGSDLDWYRAHNTSVVSAYIRHRELARAEPATERPFLNIVLYRVLFAQLMEEGKVVGGSHPGLRALARAVADPCLPGVEVLVNLPSFYPVSYPMSASELAHAQGRGWWPGAEAVHAFDHLVVLPEAPRAYAVAADALCLPELLDYLHDDLPFYPDVSDGITTMK